MDRNGRGYDAIIVRPPRLVAGALLRQLPVAARHEAGKLLLDSDLQIWLRGARPCRGDRHPWSVAATEQLALSDMEFERPDQLLCASAEQSVESRRRVVPRHRYAS